MQSQMELRRAEFDVLRARLDAMDEATKVLHETVTRIPTDTQQAVGHLKEVMAVELLSIDKRFIDAKVALDAAFAAQEKLGVQQNTSNQASMNKTETSIKEAIDKLSELFQTTTDALGDKVDDIKTRAAAQDVLINGIVARTGGANDQRVEQRAITGGWYAVVGVVAGLIIGAIGIAIALAN